MRGQAVSQQQWKTEGGLSEPGRDGALVFLQSPGTASQFLSQVLHQHQALVKLCSLKRNILLGLRTPVYKSLEEAGAMSDHPGFIRWEKLTLVLEPARSTGGLKDFSSYIRNVNCRGLTGNCTWDPWFYTFGEEIVQVEARAPWEEASTQRLQVRIRNHTAMQWHQFTADLFSSILIPGTNAWHKSVVVLPSAAALGAAHSLLPSPFATDRAGQFGLSHPIPKSCREYFLRRKFELLFMWSDALWKPVTSSHFLPQHRLIWSEQAGFNQVLDEPEQRLPYIKTNLDGSPGGRKYLLLGKVLQHVNFQFPQFLRIFQNS